MGMGIYRKIVLAVAMLLIVVASIISSVSVYSYPVTGINGKFVDVDEIIVPISGFDVYAVAGDGRNIYMFGKMGNNATIIEYNTMTNKIVKSYSIRISYQFYGYTYYRFFAHGVYANGYVYAITDYAGSTVEALTTYVFDKDLNLITKITPSDLGFRPDGGLKVIGNNVVVYGNGLAILNGSSIVASKILDADVYNVVYDGEYYVLNIENTTDYTYRLVKLDKNLNIVKVSNPMDLDVTLAVWSNGYVITYSDTVVILDKNFNTVKTYSLKEILGVEDCYIAYLDAVNNVVVAIGYTEKTNYEYRMVAIIDIDTDKIYTYIAHSNAVFPYLYTNYGFYDQNNTFLYPSCYAITSSTAYPSIVAVSILTSLSSTTTMTVVQPVPVYQTATTTITTAVGMSIEMNIIAIVAMIIVLAIGLVYVLRRSR